MTTTVTVRIYRIGSLNRKQAAQRPDGQWFLREQLATPFGKKWLPWRRVAVRPDHAWFDPQAGYARLPVEGGVSESS